jgi:hypothetical protein
MAAPPRPGNPTERPTIGKPAPHGRIQHVVQVADHLAGPDPKGSGGVKSLLVGGDDVDAAELQPLVWAHDHIGK